MNALSTRAVRRSLVGRLVALAALLALGGYTYPINPQATRAADKVLHPADLGPLVPATVFFRGQSAPVQLRNSAGVKYADGMLVFAALVDTSGYSSSVQAKYQAYLVTEVALDIGPKRLSPGAYGVGLIGDHTFIVMDIGGHDLFTVDDQRDAAIKRPTPLQVTNGDKEGEYRLYEGRDFVTFSRADGPTKKAPGLPGAGE
jgi:hypothetical protein